MKERTDRIAALVEKFLRKELSSEEQTELDAWLAEGNENKALFQQLTDEAQLLERLRIYDHVSGEAMWEKTMSKIEPGAKVVVVEFPKKKTGWLKYAAAAAVIVAVGAYLMIGDKTPDQTAKKQQQTVPVDDEVVPGGNYAVLTKVDGSTVQLEKVADGKLGQEGPMSLTKTDGLLTYSGRFITSGPVSTGSEKHASLHNMVSTPRGGQYQITLPDGSRVWLNAASSLRFPLAFAGNQRVVELTGEAYFEVAKLMMPGNGQEKMPFIVKVKNPKNGNYEVEVLGTHFSVMGYDDEDAITTTLMEGSVRAINGSVKKILKPGFKAIAQDGDLKVIEVDLDDEAVWKAGLLSFEGDTKTILNQIARWYNVEVTFEGSVPVRKKIDETVLATFKRTRTIDKVIIALESIGINARLERRNLIIKQ